MFMRRWSCDAQGTLNIEKFYQISRGREDIKEFIQKFDRIVRDIPNHLKPADASILDKFIKVVGGHLTYALSEKKPKTLVEAKEMVMEVEQNLRMSKMDVDEHLKAKVEVKKGKSKDQNEENLLVLLKKVDNLNEEMNSWDMLYMNISSLPWKGPKNQVMSPKGNLSLGRKMSRITRAHLKSPTLWLQRTLRNNIHPLRMNKVIRVRVKMKKSTRKIILWNSKALTFFLEVHIPILPLVR